MKILSDGREKEQKKKGYEPDALPLTYIPYPA
jgi:hypothetical protein